MQGVIKKKDESLGMGVKIDYEEHEKDGHKKLYICK